MALHSYQIGSSSVTTNVESLGTPLPAPRSTWNDYSQNIELADGSVRGGGWAVATWTWDFLTQAQRTQLKSFCAGKSAIVWIRTKDESESYVYKTGVCVWPDGPLVRRDGVLLDFVLRFQALETFTP